MKIAEQVRERRKEIGMTQEELAASIGSSRTYICDIECGRYEPSIKTLRKIAKALNSQFFLNDIDGNTIQNSRGEY